MKKNIAILWGGYSSEYEISKKSGEVVAANLPSDKYRPWLIEVIREGWFYHRDGKKFEIDRNDFTLPLDNEHVVFDAVFIAIHGTPGEDGKLQGYFDMLGIPYSSSGVFASAMSFNKSMCNSVLKQFGITSGKAYYLNKGEKYNREEILKITGLPCFVKPNEAGSSYGVSKVKDADELEAAIEYAFRHDSLVIIEEFIEGREVTCGVHNFDGTPTAMPLTEIISDNEFFDFEAKYKGQSREITPADVEDSVKEKVQEISKKIYGILRLNGVARIDFIVKDGTPYLIEVNTVPGLSGESIIPQQACSMGYSLDDFFDKWIKVSLFKVPT